MFFFIGLVIMAIVAGVEYTASVGWFVLAFGLMVIGVFELTQPSKGNDSDD